MKRSPILNRDISPTGEIKESSKHLIVELNDDSPVWMHIIGSDMTSIDHMNSWRDAPVGTLFVYGNGSAQYKPADRMEENIISPRSRRYQHIINFVESYRPDLHGKINWRNR